MGPRLPDSRNSSLLVVLAGVIVFYSAGLVPGQVLLPARSLCLADPWRATAQCAGLDPGNSLLGDQVVQFHAWREVVRRDGLPALFWNPYAFAGAPLAGNGQSALFYPPNWLHFVLPPAWSYVLLAILRTGVAATFTYMLARRRLSSSAASLAAASYAFSFAFVFSVGFPIGDAMTWIPMLFWSAAANRPVMFAIATALELLSGQPQTAVVAFLFLPAVVLFNDPGRREIVRLILAFAAGVGVAAPQLFLLYQYLKESAAAPLRSEFQPVFYSAHTLLEFLTPAFFGTSSPDVRWASNVGGYLGLIAALVGLAWIVSRPREAVRNPFLWIFLVSLACIYSVPPVAWILKLPVLKAMFPAKFWATATFAGAMLAGVGLDSCLKREIPWRLLAATGAVFALLVLAAKRHFQDFIRALDLVSFENRVLAAVVLSILLSLLVLRSKPQLAAVVLMLESYYYLGAYNSSAPSGLLYPKTPVIDFLSQDAERFRILGSGVLPPNAAGVFGLEDIRGYDAVTPWNYFQYLSAMDSSFSDFHARLESSPDLNAGTLAYRDGVERPARYWGTAFTDYLKRVYYWNQEVSRIERPRLLDMLNVKYILTRQGAPPPPGADGYKLVYSREVDVYENPSRLPRAFVVPRWETVASEDEALSRIIRPEFDPRTGAVLCCEEASRLEQRGEETAFREAEIVSYRADEVVIQAAGPGVLVLADAFFPGWRADGYAVYRANYLFRAVILNDGPQTVRFSFHPFSLR